MSLVRKLLTAPGGLEALEEGVVKGVFSSPNVDEMGDVVLQEGIDLTQFMQNPILLWNHDPLHPIGTVTEIGVVGGKLCGTVKIAVNASQKAKEAYALIKEGVVKSFSIGFQPEDATPIDPSRPRGPQRYNKSVLFELSVVSIPANSDARVTEKSKAQEGASPEVKVMAKELPKLAFKGLYQVGDFAQLLNELGWMHCESVWEKEMEGDDSELPGKLAELIHMAGEALLAMTQEEVGEMLAQVDAHADVEVPDGTGKSTNPAIRKFRAGVVVSKAGRAVSKATAEKIGDAMDTHNAVMAMHKVHAKCMKDMEEMCMPEGMTKAAATPGVVPGDAAPVIRSAMDSHEALSGALMMHSKCMKSMAELMPEEGSSTQDENIRTTDSDGVIGEEGTTSKKGIDTPLTKEQRMQRARMLKVSRA